MGFNDKALSKVSDVRSAIDLAVRPELESIRYSQNIKNLLPETLNGEIHTFISDERERFDKNQSKNNPYLTSFFEYQYQCVFP